jgi:hypothetical protein
MLPDKRQQDLFDKLKNEKMYYQLINQLNKDFALSNIQVQFSTTQKSSQLIKDLSLAISNLLKNNYDSYLALIYRVDISENKLRNLQTNNFETLVQQITFLILERELLKVWLKSKFQ